MYALVNIDANTILHHVRLGPTSLAVEAITSKEYYYYYYYYYYYHYYLISVLLES